MSASIEESLYIGILKTRFDLFDDVKLRLKSGEIVEGEIEGFCNGVIVQIRGKTYLREVHVSDIDDYIA